MDGRCLRTCKCRKVVAGVGRRSVMMMKARSTKRARLARATSMARTAMTSTYMMAMKKTVKVMPLAKKGKSFPDLNKDGKVTKKDILMGRGVIGKKK
jgi:hypothetical protein